MMQLYKIIITSSLLFLSLCVYVKLSAQCMMVPIPLSQQVSASDAVIEGEVISSKSFYSIKKNFIYTSYEIRITKDFIGNSSGGIVELIEEGGKIGDKEVSVTGTVQLANGQKGTFFLESLPEFMRVNINNPTQNLMFRAYASQQSIFTYDDEGKKVTGVFLDYTDRQNNWYKTLTRLSGKKYEKITDLTFERPSVRSSVVPSITSMSPLTITAGTQSELTINGSGFGATRGASVVSFKNSNNGGTGTFAAGEVNYVSWADNQIVVHVPTMAGSGTVSVTVGGQTATSASSLDVEYNIIGFEDNGNGNYFPLLLADDNSNGGLTFQYFNDFAAQANAVSDFNAMLEDWTCACGINFVIGANTAIDASVEDGVNVVRFDNGGELPVGVLGRVTHYPDNCGIPGTGLHTEEIDVVFDDGQSWAFGSGSPGATEFHFQTVVLHELGHAVGLGHVINTAEVMHFSLDEGVANNMIDANAEAGGLYMLDESVNAPAFCGYSPMDPYDTQLTIACNDSIVQLGGSNMVTISASSLANASDPICNNPLIYSSSQTVFNNSDLGLNNVTITAEDPFGSEVSCNAQVVVFANIQTVYVDKNANGSESGADWTNAMNSLSDALLMAEYGQVSEIRVAAGTYYPDEGYFKTNNDRNATFRLAADVTISGGYPSGGGNRNPYDNPTILSGEIQQDGNRSNNSYTVVHVINSASGAVMDGLIIEGGEANGPSANLIERTGAGMFNGADLDLIRCIIRDNHASSAGSGVGGGIIHYSGFLTIIDCLFHDNTSTSDGGALSPQSGNADIYNSTFADNHSDTEGGAIHTCNGNTGAYNCLFAGNTSGIAGFEDFNQECGGITSVYQSSTTAALSNEITYFNTNSQFTDPNFLDPSNGDYSLRYNSPAINQGLNTYLLSGMDLDGGPRTVNTIIDLGAHEFDYDLPCGQYTDLTIADIPIFTGTYRADGAIDSDGIVNAASSGPVTFESETSILLNPEFEVGGGQQFEAKVEDPCVD